MAGSVATITKGQMFQAADAVLANPPAGKTLAQWYQQLRQQLVSGQDSLATLASGVGVLGQPSEVQHVENEALGDDPTSFWPFFPNKEQILREGFIKAYDLALSKQPTRPIVTFWKVVQDKNVFEVVVASSPAQITWMWVTTEPPGWGRCKGLVDEDMWLVAGSDRISDVKGGFEDQSKLDVRDAGADDTPPRRTRVRILRLRSD